MPFIIPTEKGCVKFTKLNNLRWYSTAQNYITLHIVIQSLSQPNLKISHQGHILKLRQTKLI
jgi:hypothetical protein